MPYAPGSGQLVRRIKTDGDFVNAISGEFKELGYLSKFLSVVGIIIKRLFSYQSWVPLKSDFNWVFNKKFIDFNLCRACLN